MQNRLKEMRKEKGIKAVDLAKALNVAKQTVSNWENNKRQPDIETYIKLADLYQCSLDELVGRENKYNEINKINNLIATMPSDKYSKILTILEMMR